MTFLSLGWLIYINLWHSSYPHQGSTPCRISHGSSWWNHCQKSEMLWGQQLPEKNTPASHWRTGQDIYIYIYIYVLFIYLYIYIRMYIAYIMYMIYIYRGYLEPKEASLSVESKSPVETHRATTLRTWSKRPSRCGPSGALRISKRGKAVNSYVKSLEDMYII